MKCSRVAVVRVQTQGKLHIRIPISAVIAFILFALCAIRLFMYGKRMDGWVSRLESQHDGLATWSDCGDWHWKTTVGRIKGEWESRFTWMRAGKSIPATAHELGAHLRDRESLLPWSDSMTCFCYSTSTTSYPSPLPITASLWRSFTCFSLTFRRSRLTLGHWRPPTAHETASEN